MNRDRMIGTVANTGCQHRSPECKGPQRLGQSDFDFGSDRLIFPALLGYLCRGFVTVGEKPYTLRRPADGEAQRQTDHQEQKAADGGSPNPTPGLPDHAPDRSDENP